MRCHPHAVLPLAFAVAVAGALAGCAPEPSALERELLSLRRWEDTRTLAGDSLAALLDHPEARIRGAAARAIGRVGDPAGLDALVHALPRESMPQVRGEIAFALGILGEHDGVNPLVAQLEEEPDAETTAQILLALGRIGLADTTPLVLPWLESPHARIREASLEALALLADSTAVDALLTATSDPVPSVVWRAAYALEKVPGPVQVERLVALAGEGPSLVRRYAVRSLGRIGATGSADDVARLVDSAAGDAALRVRIADTLGRLGELSPTVRGAMELLLRDGVFHVRVAALQAVGRASWIELEPAALRLDDDPTVDVRAALVDAAADAGFEALPAVLEDALDDGSDVVVATALQRLGALGTEAARARLRAALDAGSTRTLRLAAASGLAAETSGATRAELEALLQDRDIFVATVAAAGLGARHETNAIPALIAASRRADDEGGDLRLAVCAALAEALGEAATGAQAQPACNRLRELMTSASDRRIRVAARDALEAVLPPAEAGSLPTEIELRRALRPIERSAAQPPVVTQSRAQQLILHTTRGRVVIDLFGEDAPQMVESFARLAQRGHFDGLTFHRVVPDFVVQGGDPTGTGWGDAGYLVRSEWNPRSYDRGTVGIAHSGKDTGSCQLFITHSPQPHLDARYTIWGQVVTGMDVVDAIQRGDTFTAEVVWARPAC